MTPTKFTCVVIAAALGWSVSDAVADPLNCSLSQYKATSGLTAVADAATLTLTWDGDRNQELRLRLGITEGTPTIQDLSVRRRGGAWASLAANVTPEFRVVSGIRRMDNQSLEGLRKNGITEITKADLRQVGMGYVLGRAAASPRRRGRSQAADARRAAKA